MLWWLFGGGGTGVIYTVNGGTQLGGVEADWQRQAKQSKVTGVVTYSDWALHTWSIAGMPGALYQELKAIEGEVLSSLQTNDIDYRNQGATYTNATMGLVNGNHEGVNVRNVTIEFRVKTQ